MVSRWQLAKNCSRLKWKTQEKKQPSRNRRHESTGPYQSRRTNKFNLGPAVTTTTRGSSKRRAALGCPLQTGKRVGPLSKGGAATSSKATPKHAFLCARHPLTKRGTLALHVAAVNGSSQRRRQGCNQCWNTRGGRPQKVWIVHIGQEDQRMSRAESPLMDNQGRISTRGFSCLSVRAMYGESPGSL